MNLNIIRNLVDKNGSIFVFSLDVIIYCGSISGFKLNAEKRLDLIYFVDCCQHLTSHPAGPESQNESAENVRLV